ncbi:MAG: hypothetical protein Q4C09_06175 [Atopobiaceae bacterium]|nr:hypothetical protein [Atopobiaceae bacterium]
MVSDLWHSFAQFIEERDGLLYVLEQSEGSRYTKVTRFDPPNYAETEVPVLEYGGTRTSSRAIACYASVDDLALSSTHALGIGTSIDQSTYDQVTTDTPHNIYLTATPFNNFSKEATSVRWLTNYPGDDKTFLGVKLTKVNDNRFLVMWEETRPKGEASPDDTLSGSVLHYLFVDGVGTSWRASARRVRPSPTATRSSMAPMSYGAPPAATWSTSTPSTRRRAPLARRYAAWRATTSHGS